MATRTLQLGRGEGTSFYSRATHRTLLTALYAQNGWTTFISMQNTYSLTYREEEREMNAYCKFAGIGLIPWGPLNAGQLARPLGSGDTTRSEATKGRVAPPPEWQNEIVRRVEKLSKDKGWVMSQVALAWIHEKVTSPIVGFSSVSHLLLWITFPAF
jgi:aryl-alcohol dehydrogenase-like predicted oxidoreductase